MGGSAGKSESSANSGSQFNQDVWGPQGGALSGMYGDQGSLWDQTNSQMQGQIPGAINDQQGIFDAANPAWQQQLQGGAYAGMDLQNQYNQDRLGGGNEQFLDQSIMGGQGNDYVDAMRGQMQQDSEDSLGRNLASNDARAASTGLSGSSRHGITESGIRDASSENLANAQTQLGYQTFDKDLDRKLGIAQRADQFDMGRLQQSGQMLGQQQGVMGGAINQGQNMQNLGMGQFAPSNAPWQAASQYANNLGGPTVLGSGSGFGDSDSKGLSGSGGVGAKG